MSWASPAFFAGGTVSGPSITLTSPANGANYFTGANIPLNATASAGAGVSKVQFFVNGSSLAIDTTSPYSATIANAANGTYRIQAVVTAKDGRTASASATVTVGNAPSDSSAPSVAIHGPANGSRLLTNNPVLFGTANDNVAVGQVLVAVNSDTFQQADGTDSWQIQLNLAAGPNTIKVKSVDTAGNESAVATWSLTYVQSSQINVAISGSGFVSPNLNGQFIQVGQRRSMTAIPAAGFVFDGWSGDMTSTAPTLVFTMTQDMSVQANFVPNPFIPVMGIYNGLVTSASMDIDHVGSFRANVGPAGGFSGQIILGARVFPVAGRFDGSGDYSTTVNRGGVSYQIDLHVHVEDDSQQLTGTISDGSVTANISSDLWTWSANNNPAPAGRYTILIPGGDTPDQPQGAGFGIATVTANGIVTVSGQLSDGARFSHTTMLARDRSFPFFVWIGNGFEVALGQITLEDNPGTSDMDGQVTWFRRASFSALYPDGFTVQSSLVGSLFTPSSPGSNVLNLDEFDGNVSIAIGGADTSGETDFTGRLTGFNRFIPDDIGNQLRFHMALGGGGMMTGGFIDPDTGRAVTFQGVAFQKQNIAAGFWMGSQLSGYVVMQGN